MSKTIGKKAKHRCNKVMKEALELFLKKGYKKTSLADIVENSGGSLSTIYEHFGSKEKLFKAIVLNGIEKFSKNIEDSIKVDSNLSLEDFLFKFGQIYLELLFKKKSILFHRLILNEGFLSKNNQIGSIFCSKAVESLQRYLITFFKNDPRMNKFTNEDLEKFSLHFLHLIKEPYFFNTIFVGNETKLNKEEISDHLKKSINIFLYGVLS